MEGKTSQKLDDLRYVAKHWMELVSAFIPQSRNNKGIWFLHNTRCRLVCQIQ